jgi:hypothetical protein
MKEINLIKAMKKLDGLGSFFSHEINNKEDFRECFSDDKLINQIKNIHELLFIDDNSEMSQGLKLMIFRRLFIFG